MPGDWIRMAEWTTLMSFRVFSVLAVREGSRKMA